VRFAAAISHKKTFMAGGQERFFIRSRRKTPIFKSGYKAPLSIKPPNTPGFSPGMALFGATMACDHVKTNRLIQEKSPYLLQHAQDPVDWYPWGEEAL